MLAKNPRETSTFNISKAFLPKLIFNNTFFFFLFSVYIFARLLTISQILQSDWIIDRDGFDTYHNFDHNLHLFAISHSGWTTQGKDFKNYDYHYLHVRGGTCS